VEEAVTVEATGAVAEVSPLTTSTTTVEAPQAGIPQHRHRRGPLARRVQTSTTPRNSTCWPLPSSNKAPGS
jgi:hypothetical protein